MADNETKKQMLRAKSLIQQNRYAEARTILKHINHPTAERWLDKLNTIAPESSWWQRNKIKVFVAVLVLLVIVLLVANSQYQQSLDAFQNMQ